MVMGLLMTNYYYKKEPLVLSVNLFSESASGRTFQLLGGFQFHRVVIILCNYLGMSEKLPDLYEYSESKLDSVSTIFTEVTLQSNVCGL